MNADIAPAWFTSEAAERILTSYQHFAVVGCSSDPRRASYGVARYLQSHGYRVVPVNPFEQEILGSTCYPDLSSVPDQVEVVDIFRRSDQVLPHVEEAIAVGAKAIWMQLGVIDERAARLAHEADLEVVMDRCPMIDHPRLARR